MHFAFSLGCRKQIGNRIACAVFRQWHGLFSLSAYCCSFPLPCLRIRRAQRKNHPLRCNMPRRGWFLKGRIQLCEKRCSLVKALTLHRAGHHAFDQLILEHDEQDEHRQHRQHQHG